jgi:hypothetical protein
LGLFGGLVLAAGGCVGPGAGHAAGGADRGVGIFPAAAELRADRPRLLLRPGKTDRAVTLAQLKALPRDEEFGKMLAQLRGEKSAAAQAMVWLLTGDREAAEAAVRRMRGYKAPEKLDSFAVYFGLRELALAYDWLHGSEFFGAEARAEVRRNAAPLVEAGLAISDDHLFHNYVWMSAGGLALWALATAGEDAESDRLYATVRERLNGRLYPGMEYLAGAPGESMWYWALYDFSPAALSVLAAQSASEQPLAARIRERHGDWLARQLAHVIGSTVPDMSYTPFGDTKTAPDGKATGPDGGVTHEMAGVLCGTSWLLSSPEGAWFDRWIAGKRGLRRFYGETAVFYFIYARNLRAEPKQPPLAVFAGGPGGGHVVARSGWDDDATVVALRSTDHYGDHNHFDQGSFMIWRRGWLALDPRVYKKVGGPQQPAENHNTLLIGGQGQRAVRGQNFRALADFRANLAEGARLETGDTPFFHDEPGWTAAAAQFAQAYPEGTVRSCVRQLLFVRPGTVVIVDRLAAPEGRKLGEVQWLLHVPKPARIEDAVVTAANGKSWLRCRELLPPRGTPEAAASLEENCERVSFKSPDILGQSIAHVLEVGDGEPGKPVDAGWRRVGADGLEVYVGGKTFTFGGAPDFGVREERPAGK